MDTSIQKQHFHLLSQVTEDSSKPSQTLSPTLPPEETDPSMPQRRLLPANTQDDFPRFNEKTLSKNPTWLSEDSVDKTHLLTQQPSSQEHAIPQKPLSLKECLKDFEAIQNQRMEVSFQYDYQKFLCHSIAENTRYHMCRPEIFFLNKQFFVKKKRIKLDYLEQLERQYNTARERYEDVQKKWVDFAAISLTNGTLLIQLHAEQVAERFLSYEGAFEKEKNQAEKNICDALLSYLQHYSNEKKAFLYASIEKAYVRLNIWNYIPQTKLEAFETLKKLLRWKEQMEMRHDINFLKEYFGIF